jgi:predicted enzyme related to lactoylglutathione lyase
MKRVIGIGGIFFKATDPEKLAAWYKKHLGLDVEDSGGVRFQEGAGADLQPKRQSHIVWSPFEADTEYFKPSEKPFMLNYRVHDLDALLAQLRSEGVDVDPKTEKSEFGYFGWIMDPEGNRIELWEPPVKVEVTSDK